MKTLYLMRHAKSARGAGPSRDHDRPLNEKGRIAALRVGEYLVNHVASPQHILCSDAARTRETLDLLFPSPSPGIAIEFRADLYLASTRILLNAVRKLPETVNSALILGHNPGIQNLALSLISDGNNEVKTNLEVKFPSAAVAVVGLNIDTWPEIKLRGGKLLDYLVPRSLSHASD